MDAFCVRTQTDIPNNDFCLPALGYLLICMRGSRFICYKALTTFFYRSPMVNLKKKLEFSMVPTGVQLFPGGGGGGGWGGNFFQGVQLLILYRHLYI